MSEPDAGHLYERIAAALRDRIESGSLRPQDRLPTQAELSATYGASRNVVRLALDLLEAEGLIDRIQGGGAFVRRYQPLVRRSALHYKSDPGAPFAEEALAAERVPRYAHETRPDRAGPDIARRLGLPVGTEVMRTDYVSYTDDQPAMLVTSYEPLRITRGTIIERPEEGPLLGAGIVDRFTAIGRRPTAIVERLRARMPRPSEADKLELRPGTPVIAAVRTSYSEDVPIETAELLFAGNIFELEYALRVDSLPPEAGQVT